MYATTEGYVHIKRDYEAKQSVSRIHANTAQWHYEQAAQAWAVHQHFLTEGATFEEDGKITKVPDGLVHPDFLEVMRKSLSDYLHHTRIADKLMRVLQ